MPERKLSIFLEAHELERARRGAFRFVSLIEQAFTELGFAIELFEDSAAARFLIEPDNPGYFLVHSSFPMTTRGLVFRRAYRTPYWRIENTSARRHWEIADTPFDAKNVPLDKAHKFARRLRQNMFGVEKRSKPKNRVIVPLQDCLLTKRNFQTASPIEMLKDTLRHCPNGRVIATLHPRVDYRPSELAALLDLSQKHSRFSFQKGGSEKMLPSARLIVSQTSTVCVAGMALGIPIVLYGEVDFQHVAARVSQLGVERAFEVAREAERDFDAYLYWFLKMTSIRAGQSDAPQQIQKRIRALGWDI